jgi:hypothetical protein
MNCAGGSLVTTTTTTASGTTTTTPGGTTTTSSIPGGTTTSVPATTTVSASSHIGTCQSCHFLNDLHASAGHTNCSQCHAGAPQRGNVTAGECIVCHPAGDPGKCNLIDFHGNTCINCHTPSMCGGSLPTTTVPATTSIPGATTTVPPGHTNSCLACHFVSDLHAQAEHNNCFQCHTGTPGKGNVEAAKCAGCHPIGNPGKCNMVEVHGSSCLTCHSSCFESNTTTTTGSTTTIPPYGHTSVCLECHFVNDIHSKTAHSNCTLCHDGTPQAGNVAPGKCVVCHPLSGPGKCNLITDTVHGSSCLTCHVSCVEGSTTTTTTILPPPECQIVSIAPPSGVKIGLGLIPRIRRITLIANADLEELGITGDDFTFEDDPRGITILSTQVLGNSVEATVLFWGARPGSYNITLAECGLISLDVSRF